MKFRKTILTIILVCTVFAACKKDSNPPQISPVGYYEGSRTAAGGRVYPIGFLVRADNSFRIYTSSDSDSPVLSDTSKAPTKAEGRWSLSGNDFDALLTGGVIDFQATLSAPVVKIQGNMLIGGKVEGSFLMVKK